MRQFRRHKRGWAWLAIVVLLSHAVALAAPKASARTDSVLGTVVICTADGAKVAPAGGDPDGPASCSHCPACVLSGHAATALLGGVSIPIVFPAPSTQRLSPVDASPLAAHLVRGGTYSRGPPLAA
jgi:hypothetical protein